MELIYPASLTKLMTAILLLDNYNLDDTINVKYPDEYNSLGKVAYIEDNTEITIENLLELLLIYSANDAAYIAALAVSDTLDNFIVLMNEKAKSLNMLNTNYVNPDGLDDDNHYTSIDDLLELAKATINNIELLTILSKTNFISNASGYEKEYKTTNLLINEGFIGIKTGWTNNAGLTFIGFNQENNRQIITIVNKSFVDSQKYNHFSDTKILYKLSIDSYQDKIIINKGSNIYTIRNSKSIYNYKSENIWNEFININKKIDISYKKYENNKIIFKFDDFIKNYNVKTSNSNFYWKFDPLKIIKIFANN